MGETWSVKCDRYSRKRFLIYSIKTHLEEKWHLLQRLLCLPEFQYKSEKQLMEVLHLLEWLRQKLIQKKKWHHISHVVHWHVLLGVQIWTVNQGKVQSNSQPTHCFSIIIFMVLIYENVLFMYIQIFIIGIGIWEIILSLLIEIIMLCLVAHMLYSQLQWSKRVEMISYVQSYI